MGKFKLIEVATKSEIKQWLDFPAKLYEQDPHYVRPMDDEVERIFDKNKNKLFRHGDATRFLLKDEKGKVISGLDTFNDKDGYYCFHAGTKFDGDAIVTNGGRVLGVTAKGSNLKEARANAYEATKWVSFENKYMRNDIGKAIDEA